MSLLPSMNKEQKSLFSSSLTSDPALSGKNTVADITKAAGSVGKIETPTLPTLAQLIGGTAPPDDDLPISDTDALNAAGAKAQLTRQGRRGFSANLLSTKATRKTGAVARTTLRGL